MSWPKHLELVEVASEAALWDWLDAHHGQEASVILVTYKKAVPGKYVSRDAVLDALIAYGWIDGRRYAVDEARTGQLISPRKQQGWAQSYRARVDRLRAEGRMHAAGETAVARAKDAGTWEALPEVDALKVPDDLAQALKAAQATSGWDASAPSYRRNVLRWIAQARRPATRADRIAKASVAAAEGRKLPQM
ncbi:YdeI/OmpD-associated family protein [Pseudaestuariivita atlantica]|uniref:YdeI/OmpD-associated family protein n=1 Tax=Pseudaestuariivita atlantica TaxID=1317121 RepID=UPI00067C4AD5|nr:YdeI/OmpD-associated family protein [Pseudaestuariivita atlantica]